MTFMKFFQRFLQMFFREPKKILGRWNIDYCQNKMGRKIDLSNEDHCGPCGGVHSPLIKNIMSVKPQKNE